MKKLISNILNGVVTLTAFTGIWSCASENPFESEGEGTIRLHTVVNAITTRSDEDASESDTPATLEDKCVVYISRTSGDNRGLIRKYVGLRNVDSNIKLKTGSYVAEAWTGDSTAASFTDKFFRGYQPFEVTKGSQQNVSVNCQIQNVVVSINTSTIDPNLMKDDYVITIRSSRGSLVFDKNNATDAKGYFMMPIKKDSDDEASNDESSSEVASVDETSIDDYTLEYTISGSRQDGKPFTKTGTITDVERAHHYILNFEYNPNGNNSSTEGAVFLKIKIKDENIQDSQVTVHARPTITGVDCNIDKQLVYTSDEALPESITLQLCGFSGLTDLAVTSNSASEIGLPTDSINLFVADENRYQPYKDAGLEWTLPSLKETTGVATALLTIHKCMLLKLSKEKTTEHIIRVTVKDGDNQSTSVPIRIARSDSQIVLEDPIVFDKVDQNNGLLISSNSATLTFSLSEDIQGTPGVEYCKDGEDSWTFVPVNAPANAPKRAPLKAAQKKYNVTITGLEAGTAYKYRAACGDFHSTDVMKFTTYSKFIIPNGDMELWAAVSAGGQDGVKVPSRTGKLDFWGNGNPGAKKAKTILTDESTEMFHSATKSARLESKFANVMGIGKFAAGNLFAGEYVKTDGTDGVLSFGKRFDEFSNGKQVDVRPSALKVYVNYRPKAGVSGKGAKDAYIKEGALDQAQIYVALTTSAIEIRTKNADKLFNPDDSEVLAYGQKTLEGNYGSDGQLQELVIPIEYFDRSNGVLPTHLVIVCSASKFGDYFSGGEGSTMYLDDFELIYE